MKNVHENWPRSIKHGYLASEISKTFEKHYDQYPTRNTGFMAAGALFAGKYFGGEVEEMAEKFFHSVNWGGAIQGGDSPLIETQAAPEDGNFRTR